MLALASKSHGFLYSLRSNISPKGDLDDIVTYSKTTGVSVSELAVGLAVDFLFDKDNWNLARAALGKDGVEFSDTTVAPMYELGERGPIVGLKIKGAF